MKRSIILFFTVIFVINLHSKEGMWLPSLLSANEAEMKALGMKMSIDDIYSTNHASIKDAIVQFNGGCTASFISGDGLLLTNHHCGYSSIQSHSSVDHDYLTDGFLAKSHQEELPNEGYTAMMVVRMEDVTEQVMKGIDDKMNETECTAALDSNISQVIKAATEDTKYEGFVKSFYYGLKYYLFVTLTYRDVRLVGAPPSSIGKFGFETDNWMWPRHSCDFSLFRVYADKSNNPADYSPDNVPYHPDYFLPISLSGIQEGDFTMVYGFPGRTREYLPSFAVDYILNKSNPARIEFREKSLGILDRTMKQSDEMRIMYAARYASISNYYKKWIGENKGLTRMHALDQKRKIEIKLDSAIHAQGRKEYENLLKEMKELYEAKEPYSLSRDCYIELIYYGPRLLRFAAGFGSLVDKVAKANDKEEINKLFTEKEEQVKKFYSRIDLKTDQQILSSLLQIYVSKLDKSVIPPMINSEMQSNNGDLSKYIQNVINKSFFTNKDRMMTLLEKASVHKIKVLKDDPLYKLATGIISHYKNTISPTLHSFNMQGEKVQQLFIKALMELLPEYKRFYPDANGTLRISYGNIQGYHPRDAVEYNWNTLLKGVIEKDQPENPEFDVPDKLKSLYASKDFGDYGKGGKMNVCFVADNHTTGGNSGSPVLDANGYLIGLNFDRCWEGTMSDIYYDASLCRNISVDIRYVLFVIDKFADAGYLLDEMNLTKETNNKSFKYKR